MSNSLTLCLFFALCTLFSTTAQAAGAYDAIDYSNVSAWLCRPDNKNACSDNLDASAVNGNGSLVVESWRRNAQAPIDCFYLYPTVSNDHQPNSDLSAQQDEEILVVREQFARFASQCQLYAPLYRQRTLASLRAQVTQGDYRLAYSDVKSAWDAYIKMAVKGRGVVLIGHSQGADLLKKLVQEEIDGKPVQTRLVSAILLGTPVAVPLGKDVGGDFKSVPACRFQSQTGCVISYASFRKTMPPPDGGWYGHNPRAGMTLVCTNPASLAGGVGVLKPYFAATVRKLPGEANSAMSRSKPWLSSGERISTQYVTLPDLLTAQCIQNQRLSYLEVTVQATPNSPRTDDIRGDIYSNGRILPQWGLHLIDVNLALGNLVELVGQQAKAYSKR
jgi:hypothetical protein